MPRLGHVKVEYRQLRRLPFAMHLAQASTIQHRPQGNQDKPEDEDRRQEEKRQDAEIGPALKAEKTH